MKIEMELIIILIAEMKRKKITNSLIVLLKYPTIKIKAINQLTQK